MKRGGGRSRLDKEGVAESKRRVSSQWASPEDDDPGGEARKLAAELPSEWKSVLIVGTAVRGRGGIWTMGRGGGEGGLLSEWSMSNS